MLSDDLWFLVWGQLVSLGCARIRMMGEALQESEPPAAESERASSKPYNTGYADESCPQERSTALSSLTFQCFISCTCSLTDLFNFPLAYPLLPLSTLCNISSTSWNHFVAEELSKSASNNRAYCASPYEQTSNCEVHCPLQQILVPSHWWTFWWWSSDPH